MAKILFKDGSILETAKAFAPKDEAGVIIFTNAHTAHRKGVTDGIAQMIFETFGNQPGANKIPFNSVLAFGDNINNTAVYGTMRQETQQTQQGSQFPPVHQVTPNIAVTNLDPKVDDDDDGLPF